MSDMTPQEARAELAAIAHPDDPGRFVELGLRALETIAADQIEYGVEVATHDGTRAMSFLWEGQGAFVDGEIWVRDRIRAQKSLRERRYEDARLVARRVSTTWEVAE
ncbi:MAG: hypothetical protein PHW63_08960 [Alphaproteobacteria bacterium]|nr:hypothetical protein [Alphaproteobacteria bacterium]